MAENIGDPTGAAEPGIAAGFYLDQTYLRSKHFMITLPSSLRQFWITRAQFASTFDG